MHSAQTQIVLEKHISNRMGSFLVVANLILLFISVVGPNVIESIVSILVLNVIVKLFFKPGIPLAIMAGLLFQWLQISIKIWYGNFTGQSFETIFSFYSEASQMHRAFYYSSVGLVSISLGIYVFYRKLDNMGFFQGLVKELESYSTKKVLIFYIIVSFVLSVLLASRLVFPGLNTIVVAITKLKWGFFLMVFLIVVVKKENRIPFILFILFEFLISFAGFFSDFKVFFIYVFIGLLSFTRLLTIKRFLYAIPLFILISHVAVIWTAVKGEYRNYLSGGMRQQRVIVSREEALSKLWELSTNVDGEKYEYAIEHLVDRVSFIDFFSLALHQVPEVVPHENGKIWSESISFYFMPRVFFPSKPVIDDSQHTAKYTGLYLAGASKGASHSIGFMADSYIDYGVIFMHIPIFLLGMVIGYLFNIFLLKSKNAVWGLVFAGPFYLLTAFYSFNLIKVIGNLLIYIVVVFIIRKPLANFADRFLRNKVE